MTFGRGHFLLSSSYEGYNFIKKLLALQALNINYV
jgi:hypothetical protein